MIVQPFSEAIWQRTCSQPDFDPDRLAAALSRNNRTNYGLTLVLGCPLPAGILARIETLRAAYEEIAPGLIEFGRPDAYHLTVYGLKRSRQTPYSKEELAPILSGLDGVLRHELASVSEIRVRLSGSVVTNGGAVLVVGEPDETLVRLRAAIGRIEGVDPLKSQPTHITVGQFKQPLGSPAAYQSVLDNMQRLLSSSLGVLVENELKVIHYRHRLLHDRVREQSIPLPFCTQVADTPG